MRNRKIFFSIICSLFVLALILGFILLHQKENELKVVFLDVGQGDAILISQGSQQVLIDGGKDGKLLLEKLGSQIPFWDRDIETIIETHPDQDHIGGLIDVVRTYHVGNVVETKMRSDSQTFKTLEGMISNDKIEEVEAKKDLTIRFSDGAILQVLYPLVSVSDINANDTNMYSVVAKLTVGKSSFLFTGDFPTTQDGILSANGVDVRADVLKVAHHGSKYATSDEFLNMVKPIDAVISVGKNNSYGHPNQETLERLTAHKVKIFRTDQAGDIEYDCIDKNERCKLILSP